MAAAVLDRQQSLATWSHHSLMNHPPLSHPFQPSPVVMPNLPQATQSFAPTMPFPQPAIPEHNEREMTRDMLITVLNDFSQTLAQHFDRFSLRLVVHGGACMLLHPGLHRLSQQLHKLNPSKPRRKTTRDVDYIHRAFVTEMASFGIDDAAEKLKACILATAQKFGLGKDWMNSDADVALPMAFDPSGKTFDPIYTASIQHYNLELHTIYRSPNGMLTLISVTPFWAVSLKLTRYSKWDPDDICLLLRNGTVLSGTNWTADTLRSWLYSNCWAMGYHKFDAVRKNQVEQRINHAIEMLNTIWSSVPVQPPSAMVQGKAVSAHDAMGGGSVVGGDDEESREGWWSNSQWPKGKKGKKSSGNASGRSVGPSASFSSIAEASSSTMTATMQMPVPIPTGGASASMPFIGPGASSHRAAMLAADAARLNSPLNVRNWSTPDPVSSERKEKRRSSSRSRSRHRSGSSGSKSRSGSPTRGRTRQQSIFVPPDADTDWPAPSYNNRDGPSTSSGSESRRPRSRSTRRRARDVSPAQQHAEYDDPWEKYYNTAGQSHHHTTPKPSSHSRTMSWNPQQQSQHGLDGMNRNMMASLQYGRNANIQTTPPQPPGSQTTQLHSHHHHHHHHSYSQSSSYRHDSQPTQPVPPTVVVTSDRRRRERQRKRDRERDRQSKRMHLTRMYDDTESDSDVGSSGEDSENDENIYAVDRNGNARSAGATATATAVGGGSSTSTFPQPVQVPGGGLVLPLHFQNGTVIFPFGSSGSGGGGNGDGNGGGSGSGSGGGQRERPVRKSTWEIYGPPSSKTTPQTQLQIPLPATGGGGAAQGVGLYSPYRSGSANPTPNSSQPGSRAQSPKHRPPQLNISGGPSFPVPVIPGVPIQGAAAHPVIPVSTSHSGPTTNGSMARSHSGGGSSGANLAMSMSMAMEDVPTPTPSSGYNPSQLAQMQFEKQQMQYRQQLMQQQQLYFKQQGQFQQGVSASGGGSSIYAAPVNGSGSGSSSQQQQQRVTYSYHVNASYSSG